MEPESQRVGSKRRMLSELHGILKSISEPIPDVLTKCRSTVSQSVIHQGAL